MIGAGKLRDHGAGIFLIVRPNHIGTVASTLVRQLVCRRAESEGVTLLAGQPKYVISFFICFSKSCASSVLRGS